MSNYHLTGRRQFLISAAAASASLAVSSALHAFARRNIYTVRVASNQGADNATLQQLMIDRNYFRQFSLDTQLIEANTISAPMEAMLSGEADICMVSAFVGFLPAIEQGKDLRLVGAAMLLPALAVYARDSAIRSVADLTGKRVGIGPRNGLLHTLTLALLRKKGIDHSSITFVPSGSNTQVFEAVAAGKVDAGLSGTAGMSNPNAARVLQDGMLWHELPEYTYQPAYASVRALKEKPEELARCLAAYTTLFRYLSAANSKGAYLDARRRAAGEDSVAEGEAIWSFIQRYQPYALDVGVSPQRVAYLQELNVAFGLQSKALPFEQVADMTPARRAMQLLAQHKRVA
jgi:NitT/TauT family transport system substrate-binding protein